MLTAQEARILSEQYVENGVKYGLAAVQYIERTVMPTVKGAALSGFRNKKVGGLSKDISGRVVAVLTELGYTCGVVGDQLTVSW